MGAKRLGGKRLGGKRLGGETTRGRNGLGAKRPGFIVTVPCGKYSNQYLEKLNMHATYQSHPNLAPTQLTNQ